MCYKYNNRYFGVVLFCFFTISLLSLNVCSAEQSAKTQIDEDGEEIIEINEINSISPVIGDIDFVGAVERHYDLIGNIDDIQSDGIVINDSYFKKANGAKLLGIIKGNRVGIILNQNREIIVCEPVKKGSK